MTQTRAASALLNLRSKQELVRLLFGHGHRTGPDNHRKLVDHSSYSYNDLRKAYLLQIQILHPDKRRNNPSLKLDDDNTELVSNPPKSLQTEEKAFAGAVNLAEEFVQLQNAWENYDNAFKFIKQTNGTTTDVCESNFTMFGVGCSFSDTEAERQLRNEIMDQASRGWFTAGDLVSGCDDNNNSIHEDQYTWPSFPQKHTTLPIIDHSDFISIEEENDDYDNGSSQLALNKSSDTTSNGIQRKCLVVDRRRTKN
jgi:hypothetical protein